MDRRIFILGTAAGAGALASVGCSGSGSSGPDGASPQAVGGAVAAPAPGSVPAAPVALLARYRTDQPLLFLTVPAGVVKAKGSFWETPARASVAAPKDGLPYSTTGPTFTHVDIGSDWAWKNRNGDWIDARGKAQGDQPHWSIAANSAPDTYNYSVDVSSALKAVHAGKRWNAYVVRGSGSSRSMATNHHATPPSMAVVYEDGSKSVLKCTATFALLPSTTAAQGGAPEVQIQRDRHAVLEFERPTGPVRSAMLTLPVVQHATGPGSISGFLVDPPLNNEPSLPGLAVGYVRDAGIRAHPDVIFAHQYADGTRESDWIEQNTLNVYNTAYWSPHVFDPAAKKDAKKLPFIHQGRWVKNKGNASLITSSYVGEGFKTLAPGLGAIRVNIPGNTGEDGAALGYAGGFGCGLDMYLPDELCGVLDEIYIRYYLRLGVHPPEYLEQMKMFRTDPKSTATYAVHGGKFGIGASHWTNYGGNNNVGGGNIGWTNRNAWKEYPADVAGGAMRPGVHSWDMIGYNRHYGDIGGLGAALYPGHWYCLESRLKLNTVDISTTPFLADPSKNLEDAEFDVWLDGRKVLEMRNFSYRKLPLDYTGPATFNRKTMMGKTPLDKNFLVPIRQLGVMAVTLNDYNGGVLPAGTDRTKFYAGLVVSKKPIGPMSGL